MTPIRSPITVDLPECPRCGGVHKGLSFCPLNNPSDDCDYWALCPAFYQPILGNSYDGFLCTCRLKCPSACKGECGCEACRVAYSDELSVDFD
jgi:hypothetical protein